MILLYTEHLICLLSVQRTNPNVSPRRSAEMLRCLGSMQQDTGRGLSSQERQVVQNQTGQVLILRDFLKILLS